MSARFFLICLAACALGLTAFADEPKPAAAIPIASISHKGAVDFEREVLPILRPNCLVCHNQTSAKAGLNLETPQTMLKGGESGPAIKPKQGSKSLLLQAAAHQTDTPMPPKGNKSAAADLTPEQLGLIKLWIDQGAKMSTPAARVIEWQALPPGLHPIYAVALTADGQFAAGGRANQIFVYHLPTGRLVTRLTDSVLLKSGLYPAAGVAHRDLVASLTFSPDGARLASGSYREVKIWQRPPMAPAVTLKNLSPKSMSAVATSADGRWLASTGDDGHVKLWNLPAGKPGKVFAGPKGAVGGLKFSPDGTRLAAAADDKTLTVWTVPDGKVFAQATATNETLSLTWLGDSRQFASGGADSLIRIWRLPDGANGELVAVKELKGHTNAVTALDTVWSTTNQILSGSADGSVRLWNVEKAEVIRECKHGGPVATVAARGDGKRFASAGPGHTATLWDADGRTVAVLKGSRSANELAAERERGLTLATNEVIFRRDTLKTAESSLTALAERVKIATTTNEAAPKLVEEKQKTLKEAGDAKAAAEKAVEEFAPVKKAVEAHAAADQAAKLAESAAKAAQEKPDKTAAEKLAAEAAAKTKAAADAKVLADKLTAETREKRQPAEDKLAAAGKAFAEAEKNFKKAESLKSQAEHELLLAAAAKVKAERTAAETKSRLTTAEIQWKQAETDWLAAKQAATDAEKPIRTLAFSPDGPWLATAGDDALIHLWSAENGAAGEILKGHAGAVNFVAFTGPAGLVSTAADRSAMVWDTNPAWILERTIGGDAASPLIDRVNALRFSPDGKLLATGGGEPSRSGEIKLWQATTGKHVLTFTNVHSDAVLSLEFSRDGKLLASGSADKFARVTDVATGKVVKSLEGHTHHVTGAAWKADGRTLATAGADGIVKVWDFVSGERRKNIEGYGKEVTSIQFIGVTDQALTSAGTGRVFLVRDNGVEVRAFPGFSDFVHAAAATPDGGVVIAGGQDGVLRVWHGTNSAPAATFAPPGKF